MGVMRLCPRIADRRPWLCRLRWAAISFHMTQPSLVFFVHRIITRAIL